MRSRLSVKPNASHTTAPNSVATPLFSIYNSLVTSKVCFPEELRPFDTHKSWLLAMLKQNAILAVVKGHGELGFSLGPDTPHNATKMAQSHTMCLEANKK